MNDHQLVKQVWALAAYSNAIKVLLRAKTQLELVQGVCEGITNQFPYVVSWVGLIKENHTKDLLVAGVSGTASAYADGIVVSWDENVPSGKGPLGAAIRTQKPSIVHDCDVDPNFLPWRDRAQKFGIKSCVAVPLQTGKKVLGGLVVYASIANAFSLPEIHLFEGLADEIAFGIDGLQNQAIIEQDKLRQEESQKRLINSLGSMVSAMSTTMELRDPYTAGHQYRVAVISEAIAKEMGCTSDQIHGLKLAALVHDIGKISIPAEILMKPVALTDHEHAILRDHVNNGYKVLKEVPFVWPIAEIVRQHHERIDGSGYPLGLKGDQILLESKILAVADTLESMSSFRPYRPALGIDKAMELILSESGKKLEVAPVMAAKKLYEKGLLQKLVNHR
ncbi:HD domain-containing phosphohydrolase [Polynucleobacter sp. MWH-UH2A]|uniref:HD domain-containing phosphohydrolase n=1 Tax=Polynucleobacter sp. MWH-UH2A TaxID=1855617 RepID=UPI001BFE702D|nr:HD domain-containing phosphohydrolase [Polynucleobacter sp. MWH-UH2A]QWD63839.1 HD domain-containing protein [Polynucleobacter sp. MWH-UH2A]